MVNSAQFFLGNEDKLKPRETLRVGAAGMAADAGPNQSARWYQAIRPSHSAVGVSRKAECALL